MKSGRFLGQLAGSLAESVFKAGIGATEKDLPILLNECHQIFSNKKVNKFTKFITDSGITLTDIEIKYIIKVIKSLENRQVLLEVTTEKVTISSFTVNEKYSHTIS